MTSRERYTPGISVWISLLGSWVLECKLYREEGTNGERKKYFLCDSAREKNQSNKRETTFEEWKGGDTLWINKGVIEDLNNTKTKPES